MTARNRGLDSGRTIALLRTPRSAELKHLSRSEASSRAETQRTSELGFVREPRIASWTTYLPRLRRRFALRCTCRHSLRVGIRGSSSKNIAKDLTSGGHLISLVGNTERAVPNGCPVRSGRTFYDVPQRGWLGGDFSRTCRLDDRSWLVRRHPAAEGRRTHQINQLIKVVSARSLTG